MASLGGHPAAALVGACLVVAGLVSGVGALVVLHLCPTGLSPLRNAVSQYGITAYRGGYRVQTLSYAVAGLGAVLGLSSYGGEVGPVVACCAVFALARGAISWFPMSPPGGPPAKSGPYHAVLALAAFLAVAVAADELAGLLRHDDVHATIATASHDLALAMLLVFIAMGLSRRAGGGTFGLVERVFYLCMTAFFVLVAFLLFLPR